MDDKPPGTPGLQNDAFDVVFAHAPTDDGEGARVLRARRGRIEAGEVRPMAEGRPITPGGQVVRLERRQDAPALFDVHVECEVPATPASEPRTANGPPQVATQAYRDSWARTFGRRKRGPLTN